VNWGVVGCSVTNSLSRFVRSLSRFEFTHFLTHLRVLFTHFRILFTHFRILFTHFRVLFTHFCVLRQLTFAWRQVPKSPFVSLLYRPPVKFRLGVRLTGTRATQTFLTGNGNRPGPRSAPSTPAYSCLSESLSAGIIFHVLVRCLNSMHRDFAFAEHG